MNKNWKKSFNGNLEFWDEKRENKISILPKFNRTVIFYTGNKSYHGHPKPLKISDNRSRKSIALYYYVEEKKKIQMKETSFVLTKKDNFIKYIPMQISQLLLKIFSFLKRYSLINDRIVTSFVKKLIKE